MRAYLLFHTLAELAAATVCFGTFLFAWNTRRFQNGFFKVLGATALFVGLLGVLHVLAFPGMQVFPGHDENLSPQLWLSARVFEAAGLLGGLLLVDRDVQPRWLLPGLAAAFAATCVAAFSGWMPQLVHASGLTPLKIALEWLLAAGFAGSILLLRRVKDRFSPRIYRLLVANGAVMAACEI